MSDFRDVLSMADLEADRPHRIEIDGTAISVVLTDGQVYAVGDTCSHAQVSLSEGEVDDCAIECWLHGARFDLRTGEAVGPPATSPIPTYEVRIEGEGPQARVLVRV